MIHARPEDLDPADLTLFKRHPVISGIVVSGVPGLGSAGQMVEDHHENVDGSGFPAGKKAIDLPVTSRILRIADGVDRFLEASPDPKRAAWQVAKDHLHNESGKSYDAQLARLAVKALMQREQEIDTQTVIDVKPSELQPGFRLAQDIYQEGDVYLLRRGVVLTARMAHRLQTELAIMGRTGWVRVYVPKEIAERLAPGRAPIAE
ncbi:MAG: hypothetical protein FJY67_01495 [Calditrichaeota bacterium]|nr:hypothetical protein [Calditrichota bacterium]